MRKLFSFLILMLLLTFKAHAQNLIWAKSMGGAEVDEVLDITTDINGNVYCVGIYSGDGDFDPGPGTTMLTVTPNKTGLFIQKFNGNGNLLWIKGISDIYSVGLDEYSIAVDSQQNVYITGNFLDTTDFDPDPGVYNLNAPAYSAFILKLDISGEFVWAHQIESSTFCRPESVTVDAMKNVYLTGIFTDTMDADPGAGTYYLTSNGDRDMFVIKLDSMANFLWAYSAGGAGDEEGMAIQSTNSGIYILGNFESTTDFHPGIGIDTVGDYGMFLLKLDPSGTYMWVKNTGSMHTFHFGNKIAIDASDNIYVTGSFLAGLIDFDPGPGIDTSTSLCESAVIIKMNSEGNYIWSKRMLCSSGLSRGFSIAVDNSNSVYSIGQVKGACDFDPNAGVHSPVISYFNYNGYLQKLDSAGNFEWVNIFGGNEDCLPFSLTIDNTGNIYNGGFFSDTIDVDHTSAIYNITSNGGLDAYILKLGSTNGVSSLVNTHENFVIYPNPTNKTVNISSKENIDKIIISDILGKKVYEASPGSNTATVDIDVAGLYFVTISSQGNKLMEKLVVTQ